MAGPSQEPHVGALPGTRTIRRTCDRELYRTRKRLGRHVPEESMQQAVALYAQRVIENLAWIHQHRSNRKLLADWWTDAVCPDIAALWNVEPDRLDKAFRAAFGV